MPPKNSKELPFMKEALRLAERGRGRVHPNPLVGAVLVKNNRIIGRGAHERFGGPHAEVNALSTSKVSTKGAALYITLEPCAHHGKTPPCTDLILKKQIKKVVVAAHDPNPLVSGKGLLLLKKSGVHVVTGVMEKEAMALNRDFNYWVRKKTPYVIVKVAQSLDGKIATRTGQSRWITSRAARLFGHKLRAASDAVLVGVNTVLKDNPLLSARGGKTPFQPVKVILDSRLRTPSNARIFSKRSSGAVILAVTRQAPKARWGRFKNKAEILLVKEKAGRVDLAALLKILGKRGILQVLIEGGGETVGCAISQKVVNEIYFFMAPMIMGGKEAIGSVGGAGISLLSQAARIKKGEAAFIGKDLLFHGIL